MNIDKLEENSVWKIIREYSKRCVNSKKRVRM